MVTLAFAQRQPDGSQREVLRLAVAAGRQPQVLYGDATWLDFSYQPYSQRLRRQVAWQEDPEEWARSLPAAYSGGSTTASVVADTGLPGPPPAPTAPGAPPDMAPVAGTKAPLPWWGIAAAALMVVGGLGPWAKALGVVDVSGREGDGWILVAGGVVAGTLFAIYASRPSVGLVIAAGTVGVLCAIVAVVDIGSINDEKPLLEPAWGIYLSLVASILCALTATVTPALAKPR